MNAYQRGRRSAAKSKRGWGSHRLRCTGCQHSGSGLVRFARSPRGRMGSTATVHRLSALRVWARALRALAFRVWGAFMVWGAYLKEMTKIDQKKVPKRAPRRAKTWSFASKIENRPTYEDFEKKNLDPQLHQTFKPIRKFFCTFLPI